MSVERFGLEGFSGDDVVMFQANNFSLEKMTKISYLVEAIQPWAQRTSNNKGSSNFEEALFTEEGLECEVLHTSGGGWQKGKLRFRLEFVPDEPPLTETNSPLADLHSNSDI